MSGLRIEELRDDAALEALAPEWDDLWARDPQARVFGSPEWLLPWRRRLGAGVELLALAARRGGELVGLAPLFVWVRPDGARQLTWLGNGISDTLDLLAAPGEAEAVAQVLAAHLAASDAWDVADLRDMPEGSPLLRALAAAPGAETELDEPRPVLDLSRGLEARVEPKLARDLRQAYRRAEALGPVAIRRADAGTLDRDLQALFDLHAARWRGRGEEGVLADPGVQAFHREAARGLLRRGWLRLYVLEIGAEVAGVHYGFTAGGCAYFYLGGFDTRFDRASPGGLLQEHALREAYAEDAREADFLRGREAYKYRWGAMDRPQVRLRRG